jgi:hypothetical protein
MAGLNLTFMIECHLTTGPVEKVGLPTGYCGLLDASSTTCCGSGDFFNTPDPFVA